MDGQELEQQMQYIGRQLLAVEEEHRQDSNLASVVKAAGAGATGLALVASYVDDDLTPTKLWLWF